MRLKDAVMHQGILSSKPMGQAMLLLHRRCVYDSYIRCFLKHIVRTFTIGAEYYQCVSDGCGNNELLKSSVARKYAQSSRCRNWFWMGAAAAVLAHQHHVQHPQHDVSF
jgi:hypothetical protein